MYRRHPTCSLPLRLSQPCLEQMGYSSMVESARTSSSSNVAPPLPKRLGSWDLHTSWGANAKGMVAITRVTVPRVVDPGRTALEPALVTATVSARLASLFTTTKYLTTVSAIKPQEVAKSPRPLPACLPRRLEWALHLPPLPRSQPPAR